MQKIHMLITVFFLICTHLYSQNTNTLKLIGEYEIANDTRFKQTLIGGLSGIEKISNDVYYLISDDFGEHGSPRMYRAKISYDEKGIQNVDVLDVTFLIPPADKKFVSSHSKKTDNDVLYCDAEAIRYDNNSNEFIWSSEGYANEMCAQPFIFYADTNGIYKSKFSTDSIFSLDRKSVV